MLSVEGSLRKPPNFLETSYGNRLDHKDWQDYSSIFSRPQSLGFALKNNPLFVIHPGYTAYAYDETFYKLLLRFMGYKDYLKKINNTIQQAIQTQRTVFVYTPIKHKHQTLTSIGSPLNIILVPTVCGVTLDNSLLQISEHDFYKTLSDHISKAEICGEWNGSCLSYAEEAIKGISLKRLEDRIFPPNDKLKFAKKIFIDDN